MTDKQKGTGRMIPQSIKDGLADGFTAPFGFLLPQQTPTEKYQTSVGEAWVDVGGAFKKVLNEEKRAFIKGPRKAQPGKRKRRSERAA